MENNFSRRSFFKLSLSSLVALPFVLKSTKALAESCPAAAPAGKATASPTEGMGKSLEYVVDAKTSKNKIFKAGQNCGNCKFYAADKAAGGYAPCAMMGNKFVTNCGWCKSYKAKA